MRKALKEGEVMKEYEEDGKKEEELLAKIRELLPKLTESQMERLLAFSEGVAFASEMLKRKGA